MAEHTPAPWTIEEYGDDETPSLVIHKDSESRVCFMATPGSHGDPAIIEANAHLISAAPDLFDALRDMSEWWAYAMAKPLGAQPNAEDHKKVEQLAVKAINALHKADPTYVRCLVGKRLTADHPAAQAALKEDMPLA